MINGEGTGRNSSVVASSDPFDGFPPRLGQKSDTGDVSPALLEQSSFGESLLSHEESSPFGVICTESKDENFPTLEPSSDINTSLYMGTYDDYNGDDFMLSRGDSGLGLLTNSAENNSSQEIIWAENDVGKLVKFGVVNESSFMPGSNDDSSPDMAVCEEHYTEHVDSDLGNFDELTSASGIPFNGGKFRRMKEAEEEISSSYEHSDDDNSLVDYGTDDEQTGLYNKRNLQYYQKAKTENENPLLINSGVAFGSDDWEQFEQEVKENSLVSVLLDRPQDPQQPHPETERNLLNSAVLAQSDSPVFDGLEEEENVIDIPIANCKVQGPDESMDLESCSIKNICAVQKDSPMLNPPVGTGLNIIDGTAERELQFISGEEASVLGESEVPKSELFEKSKLQNHLDPVSDTAVIQLCPTATETPKGNGTGYLEDHELDVLPPVVESIHKTCLKRVVGEEVSGLDESEVLKSKLMGKSKLRHQQDPLPDTAFSRLCSIATETPQGKEAGNLEDNELDALPPIVENNYETSLKRIVTNPSSSKDLVEDHAASIEVSSIKVEDLEFSESYDEIVHEMEEILLDCRESPGAWVTKGNRASSLQLPKAFRDGSSTASTSGTDDAYPQIEQPLKIDGVEVVGAKQKKGEVSLGERLVGVKEYTVYVLRVWSGKDQWEVERRYRDFFVLYRQLKTFFTDQGQNLPSPWSSVERESRKIFGNASPDVITERSALIQDCLRSILHSGFSSSTPISLIWFLSPQETLCSSSVLNTLVPNSPSAFTGGTCTEVVSTLGNTISLLVEIPPHKSMKQLIESQHYSCAGCHKHFNDGKTLLREFVETFGWGKPRLCEYTGQLFCASCHTNETAVLPARVLHFWDFTQYPVSQLAKSYLDSIYDQPMLCVSAVNPFLFSRIPALLHIMSIRKKIGAMLPYVHCPFRKSILGGLGSRRYLVESNDFFALRDLVDLSKGAFAALPIMVETVSKKILDHITEQCLVCCDVGVPCGARSACEDPPSLIFPFQEAEVERCNSCESVFHKPCFRKLTNCPCSVNLEVDQGVGPSDMPKQRASDEVDGTLDLLARRPDSRSTLSFLSGLFSKAGQEKVWGPRNNHPVILMGSLPSSAL